MKSNLTRKGLKSVKPLTTTEVSKPISYCKWSDENYRSDVCCYRDNTGAIIVHVSTHRLDSLPPIVPSIDLTPIDDFIEAYNKHNEFMQTVKRIPIGLEHDGVTFRHQYESQLLQTLGMLKQAGYHIPARLIDYLQQDIRKVAHA